MQGVKCISERLPRNIYMDESALLIPEALGGK